MYCVIYLSYTDEVSKTHWSHVTHDTLGFKWLQSQENKTEWRKGYTVTVTQQFKSTVQSLELEFAHFPLVGHEGIFCSG